MSEQPTSTRAPFLSDRSYDVLKYIAQIVLPAVGALYFALSQIWGFPHGPEIVGTITVVDAFLGALLGLSTKSYNASDTKYDGAIVVNDVGDVKQFSLELDSDPYELDTKNQVTFKVTHPRS